MFDEVLSPSIFGDAEDRKEQFRLTGIQLYNWGTFKDVHTFRVPEKGYLVMGASGSGKSTLLDAYTALLTPPKWVDFNVAAAGGKQSGKDRSYMSYVRGAVREKTAADREILKQYLRPNTTWSAISASFANPLGRTVTLVQIFFVRGSSAQSRDLNRRFLVLPRAFELTELKPFAEHDFDVRRLRSQLADAQHFDEFSRYSVHFRSLLGVEHEQALRLLHKTQSVKNLEDLNEFLREFALDVPETFKVAEQLVTDFVDLNAAHSSVVTAREQLAMLNTARTHLAELEQVAVSKSVLDEVMVGLDGYERMRRLALLNHALVNAQAARQAAREGAKAATERFEQADDKLRALKDQRQGLGAGVLEELEGRLKDFERERDARVRRRNEVLGACKVLGWTLPDSAESFAALTETARNALAHMTASEEAAQAQRDAVNLDKSRAEESFQRTREEVEALQRQRSNVEARKLAVRSALAAAVGLPESKLPFVAELLQVRQGESKWEGAIERLLRGFALSLLVPDSHYREVAEYLNRTHTGERIVWLRAIPHPTSARAPGADSVVRKLEIAEGPFHEWLSEELHLRFGDYECTPTVEQYTRSTRALTPEGLVKHGPSRHEKDDRSDVKDRTRWVLGFDNTAKRELFERKAQQIADRLVQLEAELTKLRDGLTKERLRAAAYQRLANEPWSDVDVGTMLNRIADFQARLEAERDKRPDLTRLENEITKQEALSKAARDAANNAASVVVVEEKEVRTLEARISDETSRPAVALTPTQEKTLAARYADAGRQVTLESLSAVTKSVERRLREEREALVAKRSTLEHAVTLCFRDFIGKWAAEAGGLDAAIASAPDFMAKRDRLEADGLPKHEARFKQLLRDQSDRNLTRLSTQLSQERANILGRVDVVNASLRGAPFNEGTYLVIETTERNLNDVREFQAQLKNALSRSFGDDEDEAAAEERFLALSGLVKRLGSQATEDQNWRTLVLDVRQHVEFIAREFDEAGIEREVYRSGKGKSGGQRQKLASTCLAAALRYQLGGEARRLPTFGTVVLDEAFNNADPDFTTMALNVFSVFGFQIVVATPMKSVMAMEPFVGGAVMVVINADNTSSRPRFIEYDEVLQRLPIRPEDFSSGASNAGREASSPAEGAVVDQDERSASL